MSQNNEKEGEMLTVRWLREFFCEGSVCLSTKLQNITSQKSDIDSHL